VDRIARGHVKGRRIRLARHLGDDRFGLVSPPVNA
jgi:hypothetical protein